MKLFTNGCSVTHGAEILDNEFGPGNWTINDGSESDQFLKQNTWAWYLHKKLNTEEVINLAEGASSNSKIVRRTLEFFIDRLDSNLPVDDFLAVIQWTGTARYEAVDKHDPMFGPPQWLAITPTCIVPEVTPELEKILNYRFQLHPETFHAEWLQQVVGLSSFFNQHNIKYLFCTIFNNKFDDIDGLSTYHLLPNSNYYRNSINWLGSASKENNILPEFQNQLYKFGHPNLRGHVSIADKLFNRINDLHKFTL